MNWSSLTGPQQEPDHADPKNISIGINCEPDGVHLPDLPGSEVLIDVEPPSAA